MSSNPRRQGARGRDADVLTASHLTRRFAGRVAVDDVSFELAAGEIVLTGPGARFVADLRAEGFGDVRAEGAALSIPVADPSHAPAIVPAE